MPRIRSSKKQLRKSRKHRATNRAQRTALRTALKRVRTNQGEGAAPAYRAAEQLLDRAARKGLIHRNAAARHKSRLAKAVGKKK